VVKFNNPAKLNALTVDIGNEFNVGTIPYEVNIDVHKGYHERTR
jgi:hypothetical protein